MSQPILSLAEIADIERAYELGAPTLGRAADALLARWRLPLRDDETFLRLAFLAWYRDNEPSWLTGLEAELPDVAQIVAEHRGDVALSAEARFTLGFVQALRPPLGGDEAAARREARALVERAAEQEPTSRLFREWRYLLGEAEHTLGARTYVEVEIHARYAGRGALGVYLAHTLHTRLLPAGDPRAPV